MTALIDEMKLLRARRGWPSVRAIASDAELSYESVARVFRPADRKVTWPVVAAVGLALGGDEEMIYQLWRQDPRSIRRPQFEHELADLLRRSGWTCTPPETS